MYRKSKNSSHWNSERSHELQALLISLKDETPEDDFVPSLSRGGLWSPFRNRCAIAKEEKALPADEILTEVNKYKLKKEIKRRKGLRSELKRKADSTGQ